MGSSPPGTVLTQWTIYVNPRDAPGKFVARKWHIVRGAVEPVAGKAFVVGSLDAARALVPSGLVCIERQPGEDLTIVETWT